MSFRMCNSFSPTFTRYEVMNKGGDWINDGMTEHINIIAAYKINRFHQELQHILSNKYKRKTTKLPANGQDSLERIIVIHYFGIKNKTMMLWKQNNLLAKYQNN